MRPDRLPRFLRADDFELSSYQPVLPHVLQTNTSLDVAPDPAAAPPASSSLPHHASMYVTRFVDYYTLLQVTDAAAEAL